MKRIQMSKEKSTAKSLETIPDAKEEMGEIIEKYQQLDKKIDDRIKKIKTKKQQKN